MTTTSRIVSSALQSKGEVVLGGAMTAGTTRAFDHELFELFEYRTHWLKSLIRKRSPGASPQFNRKRVDKTIKKLQHLGTQSLQTSKLILPLSSFYDVKKQWHPRRGKGHGVRAKEKAFKKWYESQVTYQNCVYAFWSGRNCLYIGRTMNGKGRPSAHFSKHWFSKATRIDIFGSSVKRQVPAFECRMTHKFEPSYSRIRPGHRKGYSRCEICEVRRNIRDEVKYIFALK